MRSSAGVVVLTMVMAAIVGVFVGLVPGASDTGSSAIGSTSAATDLGSDGSDGETEPLVATSVTPPSTTAPDPAPTVPSTTTSSPPAPTVTPPPSTDPDPLLDRADVIVAVANATNFPGVAGRTATALEALGYVDVSAVDTDRAEQTTVYHIDGFDREARRVVDDLDAVVVALPVRPIDLAPTVTPEVVADVLVVVGTDQI